MTGSTPTATAKPKDLIDSPLDIRRCTTTPRSRTDEVLRGLILGRLGLLIGPGGIGKSMLVLAIVLAAAAGYDMTTFFAPVLGLKAGRVVYLAGEEDADELHGRIADTIAAVDPGVRPGVLERLIANAVIQPLIGRAPALLDHNGDLVPAAIESIRKCARGARLLILDPLRHFHEADEADNAAMTILGKALMRIAHEEHCAILIVHHTTKNSRLNGNGDDASALRGATALGDNARWIANLSQPDVADIHLDGELWQFCALNLSKASYAATGPKVVLRRGEGGVLRPIGPCDIDVDAATAAAARAQRRRPKPEPSCRPASAPTTKQSIMGGIVDEDEFLKNL